MDGGKGGRERERDACILLTAVHLIKAVYSIGFD
jgi:hypothetical protein